MKILVFGATGVIGSECVRQAIHDKDIERITAVVRKPLSDEFQSEKLTTVIHQNFLEYNSLSNLFEEHHACIWALGVSQNAVDENEYVRITHDFPMAAVQIIAQVNPSMRFIFISGMGADPTEQSRFLFARVKGKTETDLVKIADLKEIYTLRPGMVLTSKITATKPWYERALMPVGQILKVIKPSWFISVQQLACVIRFLIKNGHHATLFENQDMKLLINENHLVE